MTVASGFEMHGIDHLSASSLNAFAAQPALWVMERLLKRWTGAGPAAARGQAAEWGIQYGLTNINATVEDCHKVALAEYNRRVGLSTESSVTKQRDDVAGYVTEGLAHLRAYGVPTGYQEKIVVEIPGVAVPFHGFLDWTFDQHGIIVDCKTAEKHPVCIKEDHGRQAAIYQTAHGNHEIRFAYVKPRGGRTDPDAVKVYRLEAADYRRHLQGIVCIANTIERFLRQSKDPQELAGLVVPDYTSFYWSSPSARAHGAATFGF